MNARIEWPTARTVCPTATRHLLAEGALLVDVRELGEVATTAFDMPGAVPAGIASADGRCCSRGQPR